MTKFSKIKQYFKDKDERNLLKHIVLAFGIKGISLFLSLFSMPLYIKYFDNSEALGLWYTILSLLNWITICDLGLGNGLRNKLTEALAKGEKDNAKKYISSTYISMACIIVPIALIGVGVLALADLNSFFNIDVSLISKKTLFKAVALLFLGVCLSFVLKVINSIIYAVQKSSINNFLTLITSAIPLLYVFLAKGSDIEKNLISLTIVHIIAVNLPLLVATIVAFGNKMLRDCTPSFKHCDKETAKSMLGFGLRFFWAQIFFMLLNSTNEIIITKLFSSSDVVTYSIYNRLFTVVGSLFMLALTPLWSKITKDLAQKKYHKIQRTNRFLYLLSAAAFVGELLMVLCCQFIVNIWLQDEAIIVHYPTALAFAFFGGTYIFNVVLTVVANGMADLKTQIVSYGIGGALKIPIVYLLAVGGAPWSVVVIYNAVAMAVFCAFQIVWIEKRIRKLVNTNGSECDFNNEEIK
ncbi:MAG: MATE family efflux transporter [Clostridia bacterium]|nr:MATE family efflux transporter [Clostridia bacterium]